MAIDAFDKASRRALTSATCAAIPQGSKRHRPEAQCRAPWVWDVSRRSRCTITCQRPAGIARLGGELFKIPLPERYRTTGELERANWVAKRLRESRSVDALPQAAAPLLHLQLPDALAVRGGVERVRLRHVDEVRDVDVRQAGGRHLPDGGVGLLHHHAVVGRDVEGSAVGPDDAV